MLRKKSFLYPFVIAIILFIAARCYYEITDDFRISHITYDLPFHHQWEVAESFDPLLMESIFSQKLHYIGKGAQCYAFGTNDGRYVIKFIKFKHHKVENFEKWKQVPFLDNTIEQRIAKHKRKLNAVFDGYVLAFERDRENTGLIALHLNHTPQFRRSITVMDKLGLERTIQLDEVSFIVQKRADVTQDVVNRAIAEGDWNSVERTFKQLFDLYHAEYRIGLYDRDRSIMKNTGFIGSQPIRIDAGKLTYHASLKDPLVQYREFQEILTRLKTWVDRNKPGYKDRFNQTIDQSLDPYVYSLTIGAITAIQ